MMRKRFLAFTQLAPISALTFATAVLLTLGGPVSAQTFVSGIISSDTTWPAGQHFVVDGDLLVVFGVTLTIEPGVLVEVDPGLFIRIEGSLEAVGTANSKIRFTSSVNPPQVGDWVGIRVVGEGAAVIDHTIVEYAGINDALSIFSKSSSFITNSTFQFNKFGVRLASLSPGAGGPPPFTFNDNIVRNNDIGLLVGRGIIEVIGNLIMENSDRGVGGDNLALDFRENLVINNGIGFDVGQGNSQVLIQCNTFANNGTGIAKGLSSSSPQINLNNIFMNGTNFTTTSQFLSLNELDAANNYWGWTDPSKIEESIHDRLDDFSLSRVVSTPFELVNVPCAPQSPVDHYKVYALQPELVTIPNVVVEDQFGQGTVELTSLGKLGVPVSKAIASSRPPSEALARPDEHLAWYQFSEQVSVTPPPFVRVKNQFTSENKGAIWSVSNARFLLVPATKDGAGAIALGQHWKCYDATEHVVAFRPDVNLNLFDQFHLESDVAVGPGRYLCNPAEKNLEGSPPLPEEHLACYDIVDLPLNQLHSLDDQFGNHPNLLVENPELLCVPSIKFAPEPGVLVSFGSGLMLLGWLDRRRRRRAKGNAWEFETSLRPRAR